MVKQFDGKSYWTKKTYWIGSRLQRSQEEFLNETLDEYMIEYHHLIDRVEALDKRIEEISYERRICREGAAVTMPDWNQDTYGTVFDRGNK